MAKKKRAQPGKFQCTKCDRAFSMKAHLARHLATIHASPQARAAKKRQPKRAGVRAPGRPSGVAARVGLRQMTLEQITELMSAARSEAQIRIAELQRAFA